jgi:hypothetical protein
MVVFSTIFKLNIVANAFDYNLTVMDVLGIGRRESSGAAAALQYPWRYSTARVLFTS